MVGVGIADNTKNYYRIYFGVSKRKWWWYILFWAILSSSQMHTLCTYAFITCTVPQGKFYYLIMILKVNSMCMDKFGKIQ